MGIYVEQLPVGLHCRRGARKSVEQALTCLTPYRYPSQFRCALGFSVKFWRDYNSALNQFS